MDCIIQASRIFNENLFLIWCIAIFLGSWTILTEIYRFIHFLYVKLIRKRKNLKQRYGKNKWALITGSSEGIGKSFALGLAKQGFNIILTARTQSKLKLASEDILKAYPQVQVKYIVADHIKTCQKTEIQSTWYKEHNLQNLDIRIVVNNAGIDFLDKLNDLSLKDYIRQIQLNSLNVSSIQYLFLQRWLKNLQENKEKQEGRYLMLNVSSLSAELPISYFAVYNATKVYVDKLTRSCAHEYPQIDFMSLRPSQVSTQMTAFKKDIFTIQPHQCTEALLDDLGYQTFSHGHTIHAIQAWLYSMMPMWFFNLLWEGIFEKEFKEVRMKFEIQQKQLKK